MSFVQVDCTTGQVVERPYTDEEAAEKQAIEDAAAQIAAAQAQRQADRAQAIQAIKAQAKGNPTSSAALLLKLHMLGEVSDDPNAQVVTP
jgi:cbb3-type cytochrome oxidase cytochrome c subunit